MLTTGIGGKLLTDLSLTADKWLRGPSVGVTVAQCPEEHQDSAIMVGRML